MVKGTLSRVGKYPIAVPPGVKVALEGRAVKVAGPKGILTRDLPPSIEVTVQDGKVLVASRGSSRDDKAVHGLTRTILANMVRGAGQGFVKELIISGVGYKAEPKGKILSLSLGFTHPIEFPVPEGIKVSVEKGMKITVEGADKELVGRVAAQLRGFKVPDPYKEKGIKYVGEVIQRKVGKAAATTQTKKG